MQSDDLNQLRREHGKLAGAGLSLSMTRGQPSDAQLDLCNAMLQIVGPDDVRNRDAVDIRNYPGGVTGLVEARELFAGILGVEAGEVLVGNNASLMLMGLVLGWGMQRGMRRSTAPWFGSGAKLIVTVPGYDRHFELLEALGYEMLAVPMTAEGPDIDQVEALVREDESVRGMLFVPVYSNPTGDTASDEVVRRLAAMPAAAPDFTLLADNAYAVHHLDDAPAQPANLLRAAEQAGNPDRVVLFASTSKITFASGGIACLAASCDNIAWFSGLLNHQTIGPNKVEQLRHVRFLASYPGGLEGLMRAHAALIRPKFDCVQRVLGAALGESGLATWTRPSGGYFISLGTTLPVASRVVELAAEAGVALTPAGATFPGGRDPHNRNIRLAPTRPPLAEVEQAMHALALCVRLASAEYSAGCAPGAAGDPA